MVVVLTTMSLYLTIILELQYPDAQCLRCQEMLLPHFQHVVALILVFHLPNQISMFRHFFSFLKGKTKNRVL